MKAKSKRFLAILLTISMLMTLLAGSDIEGAKDKVTIKDYTNKYIGV